MATDTTDRPLALVERSDASPATLAPPGSRGRLLNTEDIQELYGRFPEGHPRAGQFRKSRWWVTHNFCPEFKIKQGRDLFWYESDAHAWLEGLRQSA